MKNIQIENAKRNVVLAYGKDRAQARVRTVKGEPGLYEVVVLGDGGAHTELKKGEKALIGPASDIKDPAVCDGHGHGHHFTPEYEWWTPAETATYCRTCANARNRDIAAAKKAGTWVPQGKKSDRDPETGQLTAEAQARLDAFAATVAEAEARTREESIALILRNILNGAPGRNDRKGQTESRKSSRFTSVAVEHGLTFAQALDLVPEAKGVLVERTWREHRQLFPLRVVEETDAA